MCDSRVFGTEVTEFLAVPAGQYAAIPLQKFFRDVKYTLKPRDLEWSPTENIASVYGSVFEGPGSTPALDEVPDIEEPIFCKDSDLVIAAMPSPKTLQEVQALRQRLMPWV